MSTPMSTLTPRLLDADQLAEHLSITYGYIKQLRGEGKHPLICKKAIKMGRKLVWKDYDVAEYINSLEYDYQE